MLIGGVLGLDRLRARAGEHRRQDRLYRLRSRRPTISPSAILPNYPYLIRTGWTSSQPHPPARAMGLRAGLQEDRRHRRPTMRSATRSVGGFQKAFEDCGGQIIQKIWPPLGTKDFGPYIPTIKADADAIFTLMVGPMVVAVPQAACGRRHQEADRRRRHQLRRVRLAVHGRRGDRRRLGAAIQRRARKRRRTRRS